VAIGGLGAAAVAITVLVLSGGDNGNAVAQETGIPTVALERRDLAARESIDGTLGYAGAAEVINRLNGTITWLPAEGDVIDRGGRLFAVDGQPVVLMYGDVPAYRDLASGVSDGPDVKQLESNLDALGFDPGSVDDHFTSTTAEAVAGWQDSLGIESTGEIELGRVVFMAGARRVTSLSVPLGSSGGSTGSDGAQVSDDGTAAPMGLVSYVADDPSQPAGQQQGKGKKQKRKPKRQPQPQGDAGSANQPSAAGNGSDGGGDSSSSEEGNGASNPATEVMVTSSERRVVTVELDPSAADIAKRGRPAQVSLPDGKELKGRVSSVGTVAESDDSSGQGDGSSDPTIEVTIALPEDSHVTGLDQAPVSVDLTEEVRRDVFAVPVESLLGTAGGGYAIVVVDADGRRQLAVRPGLFAEGYVEVEGSGLREGMQVEVPGE
jgi:hypothetical protein